MTAAKLPPVCAQPDKAFGSRYYRPELDVVRFFAFIFVFVFHTLPTTKDPRVANLLGGFAPIFNALSDACGFGLSLFFTLSAFLICELLFRERSATGAIGVKRFYLRRLLRIWPLYYLGIALGAAAALLPGADPASAAKLGWFAIFLGAWFCAAHGVLNNPANVLWSMSVEEQFYLFAPWIIKLVRRKSLFALCLLLIIVANAELFYLGSSKAQNFNIWFNSLVQFQFLAAGMLLCLFLNGRLPNFEVWQRLGLLLLSLSCWFYACFGMHAIFAGHGQSNPGSWRLIAGYGLANLGSILILIAFLGCRPGLLPKWSIYLGRISFGMYVYHEFAISLTDHYILQQARLFKNLIPDPLKGLIFMMSYALALGLTIAAAAISYKYFETPFLKLKMRYTVVASQPVETFAGILLNAAAQEQEPENLGRPDVAEITEP